MTNPLHDLRDRWRSDAETRKARFPADQIANVLELAAAELDEVIVGLSTQPLSPAEYAVKAGVSPQAVTKWCRQGRLEAYRDECGRWWIPPHAAHQEAA